MINIAVLLSSMTNFQVPVLVIGLQVLVINLKSLTTTVQNRPFLKVNKPPGGLEFQDQLKTDCEDRPPK